MNDIKSHIHDQNAEFKKEIYTLQENNKLILYNLEMALWINKCAAIGFRSNPPINKIMETVPPKSPDKLKIV